MKVSVIVPCFNEEGNVDEMYTRLTAVLSDTAESYDIIFINDGSTDTTLQKLLSLWRGDDHVTVVELSRNFGHQAAICAGMDYADGDAVVMLDADLQHPPELIPMLVEKWRQGFEVVYTIRNYPPDISLFKKITAALFYRLINILSNVRIPENAADFRLLDKKVVQQLRSLKEGAKFIRGLICWAGFSKCEVRFDAAPRHAGESKYSLLKMIRFAFDGITSFSTFPLKIATFLGLIVSAASFSYAMYAIYIRLFTTTAVPGWTSVLVAVLFLGGIQLLCLGVIGEYLGRVHNEAKSRPAYVARNIHQHQPTDAAY